jgi:clan AA aspartic protease
LITGTVTRYGREAVIPLTLPGDSDRGDILIQAVIDTGFTDRLTLPPEIVEELKLPLRGAVEAILADGSVETLPVYRVRLLWHGKEHDIRAYAASGDPLAGMALLAGSELRIEAAPGGAVVVEEL